MKGTGEAGREETTTKEEGGGGGDLKYNEYSERHHKSILTLLSCCLFQMGWVHEYRVTLF